MSVVLVNYIDLGFLYPYHPLWNTFKFVERCENFELQYLVAGFSSYNYKKAYDFLTVFCPTISGSNSFLDATQLSNIYLDWLYCPGCFSMLLHSQDGYKTRNHFQALSCVKEEQERKDIQTTVRGMRTYMYYVRISSTKGSYKLLFLIFGSNQRNVVVWSFYNNSIIG